MLGYLATIGWEVYAPDLRAVAGQDGTPPLARMRMEDLVSVAGEALDALGRPAIVLGHGLGGLIALKLAETREIKAAVALAPLVPGFRNPLIGSWSRMPAIWLGRPLAPPSGRALFEFLLDVEAFQRPAMVGQMVPDAGCGRPPNRVGPIPPYLAPRPAAAPDHRGRRGSFCSIGPGNRFGRFDWGPD